MAGGEAAGSAATGNAAPFRSYSANFEDVLLHRVFGAARRGFFVDVGAAHPVMENDFHALYCQGWRGVNVEPNATWFSDLRRLRPHDRNINAALSDREEERTYYEVVETGLSTLDPDEAARCQAQGWNVVERRLRTRTLAALLDEQPPTRFDVLKVDVEGLEEQVLRGNDWQRYRPSLILVEATLPERSIRRNTTIPTMLEREGYRHLHFDGLNDFYVEADFHDADEALGLPPNVFDHFVSYRTAELEEANAGLAATVEAGQRDVDRLEKAALSSAQHVANLEAMVEDLRRQLALAADERLDLIATIERERASADGLQHRLADADAERARLLALATDLGQRLERSSAERLELVARLEHQASAAAASDSALQGAVAALRRARQAGDALSADVVRLRASVARLTQQNRSFSLESELSHRDREELLLLRIHVNHLVEARRQEQHEHQRLMEAARQGEERLRRELDAERGWLDAVRGSTSWTVTRPFRVAGRSLKRMIRPGTRTGR